jgi:hypothetical protein
MTKKQKLDMVRGSNKKPTIWTKEHEKILIDWGDKAICYRWLHAKSHNRLSKINAYFTIPVIIMSTLTGTANFAQDRVPVSFQGYYSMLIGFVNIVAGIITTIQQFLKISELNEAHRVSSISWDKFYRKIRVELAKSPNERQNVYDFLKSCTEEFDRLMETSPVIQKHIIQLFQNTFDNELIDEKKRKMFEQLKKPEICDSLESIKSVVYQEDKLEAKKINFKRMIGDAITTIQDENNAYADNQRKAIIDLFVNNFKDEMLRIPTKVEILNNVLTPSLNIDESYIDDYIKTSPIMVMAHNEEHDQLVADIENDIRTSNEIQKL